MKKAFVAAFLACSLFAAPSPVMAGGKGKPKHKSGSSNLKESFRSIGHGFRDAGRAVGRDAKAGVRAVKKSEKGK